MDKQKTKKPTVTVAINAFNEEKNMKILIPNATSPKNIGDLAILTGLVSLLGKNNKIKIHSTEPQLYDREFDKFKVSHTLYSWAVFKNRDVISRVGKIGELLINYGLLKFGFNTLKIGKSSLILEDYLNADMILFTGGGYLRSQKGIKQSLNFLMTLLHFHIAKKTKAKKIVAPISFGPFAYKWQEKIAAKALQGLDLVAAREGYSYRVMKKNKINNLILSSDFALLLKKKARKRNKAKHIVLGFTIRSWFDKKKQNDFEENFTEAIRRFSIKVNTAIQPIVQVNAPKYGDWDLEITKRIAGKLKDKGCNVLKVEMPSNLNSAIEKYANIDLLLGMRMHSNVLAATQSVPFVGVSYEYKTKGIMKSLGVEQFCISCEELTTNKLTDLLNNLYKDKFKVRKIINDSIESIRSFEEKRWNYLLNEGGYK